MDRDSVAVDNERRRLRGLLELSAYLSQWIRLSQEQSFLIRVRTASSHKLALLLLPLWPRTELYRLNVSSRIIALRVMSGVSSSSLYQWKIADKLFSVLGWVLGGLWVVPFNSDITYVHRTHGTRTVTNRDTCMRSLCVQVEILRLWITCVVRRHIDQLFRIHLTTFRLVLSTTFPEKILIR